MRWIFLSLLVFCSTAASAETATFYLNDGSSVVGEVLSLEDGVYLVNGAALGKLEIEESNVRSVRYGVNAAVVPDGALSAQPTLDVDALATMMMERPAILTILQSLQSDPEFQSVIADPEIQSAIASGNYLSLMANPKILELMSHDKVRAIINELQP